jgi:hypothetical protein
MLEAKEVMCCTDCDSPLTEPPWGGPPGWCPTCCYLPSMQDTYLRRICPGCDGTERIDGTKCICQNAASGT